MIWPKVLYQFPQCAGKQFSPSNGTEGMIFEDAFCLNCLHEKFMHTQNDNDKKCDIYTNAILHWPGGPKNPEYPKEWVFNDEGWPICAAWQKWDWNRDDDDNWNDPPVPEPVDPNQLVLPFIIEDELFNKRELINKSCKKEKSYINL